MIRFSGIFVGLFFLAQGAMAQAVETRLYVDTARCFIGDQIQVYLEARFDPQKSRVLFPAIPDSIGPIEVISKKSDTVLGREQTTFRQQITITCFDSGRWTIPAQRFDIQPLNGAAPLNQWTDSIQLDVRIPDIDTSQPFKPIMPLRDAGLPLKELAMYFVIGIVALLLIGLAIWYLRKKLRKKNAESTEPEVQRTPFEQAMYALSQLESKALWQNGKEKEYHTILNDLLRSYLEAAFGYDCFEKTNGEILKLLRRDKELRKFSEKLKWVFDTADMVKFARSQPSPQEHEESFMLSKYFIEESHRQQEEFRHKTNTTPKN